MTEKYGTVDLKAITEATAAGEFAMGYTNPFASSAGMNFLICTLSGMIPPILSPTPQ